MLLGNFGAVEIDSIKHTATKRPRYKEDDTKFAKERKLYSLSKELFYLKHLEEGRFTPEVLNVVLEDYNVCGHRVKVVKEIEMEDTGLSLLLCYQEGILLNAANLLLDVMNACQFLQNKNVLHLDIKSNNITFCLKTKQAKLIDFGLSEPTDMTYIKMIPLKRKCDGSICDYEKFGTVPNTGSLFYHNNFGDCEKGKSVLPNEVNHPIFRDPTLLCANFLQVEQGLINDARVDVYGGAMSVMHYLGWLQHFEYRGTEDDCIKLLSRNRDLVGSLSLTDVMWFRGKLLTAAQKCENEKFDEGLCWAMQSALSYPANYKGMLNKDRILARVYGNNFAMCLKRALHPVNRCRAFSQECLMILETPDKTVEGKYTGPTSLSLFMNSTSTVVGQIRSECVAVVSIGVTKQNKLIWYNAVREVASEIIDALVSLMHREICNCKQESHTKHWFASLDYSQVIIHSAM